MNKHCREIIANTVEGYLSWFEEQNRRKNHSLFFFNVPAPVYDKKLSSNLNAEAANTVFEFNVSMKELTKRHGFQMIDVYKLSVDDNLFSNKQDHIDNRHLGPMTIHAFEQQLN